MVELLYQIFGGAFALTGLVVLRAWVRGRLRRARGLC